MSTLIARQNIRVTNPAISQKRVRSEEETTLARKVAKVALEVLKLLGKAIAGTIVVLALGMAMGIGLSL